MNISKFFIVIIVFALAFISVYAYENELCKSQDLCLGDDSSKCGKYVDKIEFGVEVRNSVTNEVITYPFCVRVDKFSRVTLRKSYQWMTSEGREIKDTDIVIRIGNLRSRGKKMYSDGKSIASALTAILNFGAYGLDSGKLKGIDWDDTCSAGRCMLDYSSNCIDGKDCGVELSQLDKNEAKDISIFIGFRGSDKFGNLMTSANEVPKTYRALSFGLGAVQFYDKALDILPI